MIMINKLMRYIAKKKKLMRYILFNFKTVYLDN